MNNDEHSSKQLSLPTSITRCLRYRMVPAKWPMWFHAGRLLLRDNLPPD
jgi:hypothetical protein